jgi:hypothetical protein
MKLKCVKGKAPANPTNKGFVQRRIDRNQRRQNFGGRERFSRTNYGSRSNGSLQNKFNIQYHKCKYGHYI